MSDQQGEEQAQAAREQRNQRAAAGCLAIIGITFAGTLAVTVPETGYYTAGLLTAAGVRRACAWAVGRRNGNGEQADEDVVDIVAALHELSPAAALNVRLTMLQEVAGLPDTKAVRALLDEAGIPVKAGVRADGKNGPGVHHGDIPRSCDAPSEGCWCRSGANTNTNTNDGAGPEKGFRVEHTGHAGITVYDLSETHQRRHTAKT